MSQSEAVNVMFLGMAVVFAGLAVMMMLARAYGRVAAHLKEAEAIRGAGVAAPEVGPAARPDLPPTEPVPADVLAVIAAVIEVETKLYLSRSDARLTIRRPVAQP